MNDETILRTRNYYNKIDQHDYYRLKDGTPFEEKATYATKHKDVYLSDLVDNERCTVSFSAYRDTDNKTAAVKIAQDVKGGNVRSYNPETNLLAIDCIKKRPSKLSAMFNLTHKMRYVEPSNIIVSSISRDCKLRRVPEASKTKEPGMAPEGGKRNTRKRRNSRNTRNNRNNRNNRNKRTTRNARKIRSARDLGRVKQVVKHFLVFLL